MGNLSRYCPESEVRSTSRLYCPARSGRLSPWFGWGCGMGGRRAVGLVLTDAERAELQGLAARRSTAQAMALRARIVLAYAGGAQNKAGGVQPPSSGPGKMLVQHRSWRRW